MYTVPPSKKNSPLQKKNFHLFIFRITLSNINRFQWFWCVKVNNEKIWHSSLYICPPHLYTVATLPWEIQQSHFQQYYLYILQIIYIISEENKLLPPYPPHLKSVTALPCKMLNLFIRLKVMLRSSKHWCLWKEPVVMCGNWDVKQATPQQVFKVTTFCMDTCLVFFRHWSTG